jgi:hypothetical protein
MKRRSVKKQSQSARESLREAAITHLRLLRGQKYSVVEVGYHTVLDGRGMRLLLLHHKQVLQSEVVADHATKGDLLQKNAKVELPARMIPLSTASSMWRFADSVKNF